MHVSTVQFRSEFEFIISEFIRFASMEADEFRENMRENFLSELHDGSGRRWTIGREAFRKLRDLSDHALAKSPFDGRVDPERAFREVRKGFGRDFIKHNADDPSEQKLFDTFQDWIAAAGTDCKRRVHLLPCHIGLESGRRISIGPVDFASARDAMPRVQEAVMNPPDTASDRRRSFNEKQLSSVEKYYSAFSDIAFVTIDGCDEPTSKALAETTVRAALDLIHVLGRAHYTEKMRLGGPATPGDRRAEIFFENDGAAAIALSSSFEGANLADQWWEEFDRDEMFKRAGPVGGLLDLLSTRQELELLGERFLDACAWYGDAVRDRSRPSAIVKYLTAMERLLWTGENSGVTKRLSTRAAALCFTVDNWNYSELTEEVRLAYDLRSSILHGRYSRSDSRIQKSYFLCERVARTLIDIWLARFGSRFFVPVTMPDLKEHLDSFVQEVSAADRHRGTGG
ncbi:MAG: HEPN domain-containing protein [Caulobacter sp.]|nr:HEPN domain-containing protein [Caulobacter sp.]RYG88070.1 MAG: hypothetical protein EON59_05545 [Alphaproteobacteria bacterium]